MAITRKVIGGLFATVATVVTSLSAARISVPQPPAPDFWRVLQWAVSGNDPLALATAIIGGIAAGYSIWQMMQAPAPSRGEVSEIVGDVDRASGERDELTHKLLTGDLLERTEAAIESGTLDDTQRRRLIDKLSARVKQETDASGDQALRLAETAADLAQSPEASDRSIAEQVIEGDVEAAADRLIQEARAGKLRNAERFRQAARLFAPFSPSKAMSAYSEAVDLDPTDIWSWIELGRIRQHFGTLVEARNCFAIALQHVADERDRAVLHHEFGGLLMIEGELPEARAEFESGLTIAEKLATYEPGNTERQRDLSVSYERLGDVEVAAGNLGAARERYEAGLAIREKLAAHEPGNTEWQRDLSVSYERLGDVERAAGNLGAARERYEAGLAIADKLAAHEPGNTEWQRDLSISHNKVGDVEVAAGHLGAARKRYEAGLAIREKLAAHEPGNTEWQRDLSVSYERLGDVERAAGNLGAALERYEAGLAIADKLAAHEPSNTGWQRDVFVSNVQLARLAEADSDRARALERFGAAERVMAALAERKPDHPGFAKDLAQVRADIARLGGEAQ